MKTKKNNAVNAAPQAVNEVATATVAVAEPTPTAQIKVLATPAQVVNLSTDLIEPSNLNARKTFDPETLRELAQNIATHGVIQPITVRASSKEHYEIICGERRFRASRLLNMPEIPAIIQTATDEQAYDLSISENLQREDVPPIEAAEAYKRLIDTGRYDVKTLALQFGRSEKSIYQVIKLCDLIGGIADLVRTGKLSASCGVVVSKYDKKIQKDILADRFGKDGQGDWCNLTATALDGKIKQCYTNDLADYTFDKTECQACTHNSQNYDLFAGCGNGCGRCTNAKCLQAKQRTFVVEQAKAVVTENPKVVFIRSQYGSIDSTTEAVMKEGHEFKEMESYNTTRFPNKPVAPAETEYKAKEDFAKAQETYERQNKLYEKKMQELDTLKEQGKIRVYATVEDRGIEMRYKEVKATDKPEKTPEQAIADLTDKKKRNNELAREKTVSDIKDMLHGEELPNTEFTVTEEQMMYYFMMMHLRKYRAKLFGVSMQGYGSIEAEKRLKIVQSLTEEQKTAIRRDFLYRHLKDASAHYTDGDLLMDFAKMHMPDKTAKIEADHKAVYDKKNARLDERIAGLKAEAKKAAKKTKPEAKAKADEAKPTDTAKTKTAKPKGKAVQAAA